MRSLLVLSASFLFAFHSFAQLPVPRVPVYEVFSSSTCPPCRPANEHMTPIFKEYVGELAIVKYQMSWPGAGDPYYTQEGNTRRSAYGVSSVPALYRNSNATNPTNLSANMIDNDLEDMVYMDIQLRYMIDTIEQSIRVRARIEAIDDFTDGGHRVMIPIVEYLTTKNKESNGENEFHNVFKKMLPESNGELIIGEIEAGEVLEYDHTYTFQGNYRLPNNAQDPINHNIEHSVEEFNDLHAVMFVQSLVDKEIYQGAVGVREYTEANMDREWGEERIFPTSVREFNEGKGFALYPNPGATTVHMRTSSGDAIHDFEVIDIHGRVVYRSNGEGESEARFDVRDFTDGIYTVRAESNAGVFQKRLVVRH